MGVLYPNQTAYTTIDCRLSKPLTKTNVPVEVLGVLIAPEVGDDAARAVLFCDVCGDAADHGKELGKKIVTTVRRKQIGNVYFGNNDDVHRPMGFGVMERKHTVGFYDHLHLRPPAQHLVAIKIIHSGIIHRSLSITASSVRNALTDIDLSSTMHPMFHKALFLNFELGNLNPEYWRRIDKITKDKVLLKIDSPELNQQLATADGLLLKLGMGADKALIDRMPKLKYIGMFGTGYGRINAAYAKKKGVTVCNIAGYATEGVAEFVFAALLEHLREISRAEIQAAHGDYSEATYTGTEIKGKTFGVIGLGRIGRRVAELGSMGFDAHVLYWSHKRKKDAEKVGIRYAEVDELLKNSDIISIHLSFNPETQGFFDAKHIGMIKPGAVVINTAPMELIDIEALEKRLKKNDITFILDHSDELDPSVAKRLLKFNNGILFPPIAYTTKEATNLKQEIFVSNLENFLRGKPTNKVT